MKVCASCGRPGKKFGVAPVILDGSDIVAPLCRTCAKDSFRHRHALDAVRAVLDRSEKR